MKRKYLERLESMNNVQQALVLLGKLGKYSQVGKKALTSDYLIYNHWLQVDVSVSEQEFNYLKKKLQLA